MTLVKAINITTSLSIKNSSLVATASDSVENSSQREEYETSSIKSLREDFSDLKASIAAIPMHKVESVKCQFCGGATHSRSNRLAKGAIYHFWSVMSASLVILNNSEDEISNIRTIRRKNCFRVMQFR